MPRTRLSFALAAVLAAGCAADSPTAPGTPELSAVKFWNALASVDWNERAADLSGLHTVDVVRMNAYLSLAQLRAAEAAAEAPGPHPPISAAIGGASAVVLSAFFPAEVALIEAALDEQQAADPWPGSKHASFAAGEAIGRAIGAAVVTYSLSDGVGLTDPGPPPVGPGYWSPNGGPIRRGNLGARPFFLDSGDEFRPAPPPAFGSPEFLAALAEVRQISDTRTAEQLASAIYWHVNQSPSANGPMQALARELIVSHHRNDTEAARILFLANASIFDALIGCFDAKYEYWLIRPPQADPGIVTPFPVPGHPSYPSAHSCISGAITETLALEFPVERERVEALALEAALSRVYAGIHYRFDATVGLALGRSVAQKAAAADLSEVAVLP